MIEINNLTTIPVNKNLLEKIAIKVLQGEGVKKTKDRDIELSFALVSRGRIKELNKKYRGKNGPTDVLAFVGDTIYNIQNTRYKILNLGEVIICPQQVKRNAKKIGSSFDKELALCLIHGILHLLGENHEKSKKAADKMEKKQNYYLSHTFL